MTLCEVSPDVSTTTTTTTPGPSKVPDTWGWAVVEIRGDETWGQPVVVPAAGAAAAVALAGARPPADLEELLPLIHAHLGSQHLADGELHHAVGVLTRGAQARGSSQARDDCLGRVAHLEAILGDLRRASRHAGQVRRSAPGALSAGSAHAHLARAWVALERTDVTEVRRHLDLVALEGRLDEDRWLRTSHLLVEATLLLHDGQPDAATRLLAAQNELGSPERSTDWHSELVDGVRARALLASGEPQRALAVVTPMPARTRAQAAVLAAAARRDIGDLRGAQAVLSAAISDLERAPLTLQIEAWLLEAHLAHDRGKLDRARQLTDRALRLATSEQMRRPLIRDGRWLRHLVAGDPALLRSHRGFLSTCPAPDCPPAPRTIPNAGAAALLIAPLTEREGQVLELLAQMYSTEEIAASLFVSSNTVKTHLKGIFGKLCVNRRVEAVRAGRQLGLC